MGWLEPPMERLDKDGIDRLLKKGWGGGGAAIVTCPALEFGPPPPPKTERCGGGAMVTWPDIDPLLL